MSLLPRLQLKQPTGWFAAGREVAEALTLLPDPAFRLYLYICLNADRHTGRLVIDSASLARVLGRDQTLIEVHLCELVRYGVCRHQAGVLEISDRFWPYQKQLPTAPDNREADYVRSVRNAFLEPACVCSAFTPGMKSSLPISTGAVYRWRICAGQSGWAAPVNTWRYLTDNCRRQSPAWDTSPRFWMKWRERQ